MTDMLRRTRADMERRPIMRLTRPFAVAALAAVFAASQACAAPTGERRAQQPKAAPRGVDVAAAVGQAIAASGLDRQDVAVSVRDAVTGRLVADVGGDRLMTPASNMKVLTTGAALFAMGPDFKFRTRLLRDGDRLVVLGDGDPSLGDPEFGDVAGVADQLIGMWVDGVQKAGIKAVRELVVDDRVFDRQYVHPEWPADQLGNAYCAEIAGLNYQTGLAMAYLGQADGRGQVTRWSPAAPWLRVVNKSTARGDKKADQTVWVGRTEDPTVFTLNGNVKAVPKEPIAVCVHDMPAFFGRVLGERLRAAGIAVGNVRTAESGDPKFAGQPIAPVFEAPLAAVLERCNTDSQNLYAESLLKRMAAARTGQPGSWPLGCATLASVIDERLGAGTAAKGLVATDGSGLSRGNKVAANLVTAWLGAIAKDPKVGPAFIGSLAVGGKTGTVKKRFKDIDANKVFVPCKTGYINGVSCLSGYVGPVGGAPRFAFSVLCNDLTDDKGGVTKAKALQEKVATILGSAL
jgi:D-alanyl-D-alanine carboxypeptidase/D-alanyl-D-alanine-endopeptidase (penicillin-binding protein 4)